MFRVFQILIIEIGNLVYINLPSLDYQMHTNLKLLYVKYKSEPYLDV